MLTRRMPAVVGLCAAAVLVAAGCGSDDGSSDTGSAGASAKPTTSASGTPTPNPEAPDYKRILDNAKDTVDTAKYKKDGPYKIAAITEGPINGWGTLFDAQLKQAAGDNPEVADLKIYPSMADPEQQAKDLELQINQKPDAIILTPMSTAALSAPITRAKAAGIPVINCMARSEGEGWVTEVGQPLYPQGFDAVVHLAKMLGGKGNIVQLNGIPGVDAGEIWKAGAKDALAQYPNIKVIAEGDGNWSPADAKKVTSGFIAAHPQIDGVLTMGMEMGVGALNAFEAAHKAIPPMSGTGSQNGFNRLATAPATKTKFWSVSYTPSVSKPCLDTTIKVLKGESVPKYVDGTKQLQGDMEFDSSNAEKTYHPDLSDEFPLGPTAMTEDQLKAVFPAQK